MELSREKLPSSRDGHLLSLDLIKGICILMVIATHLPLTDAVRDWILHPFTVLPAVPMFVMCTIYALSLSEDRRDGDVLSYYERKRFLPRMGRFLVPYAIATLVIIAALFIVLNVKTIFLKSVLKLFFRGGRGPGSYYVWIYMQLLLFFPLLRAAFKKNGAATVLGLIIAWIAFEFLYRGGFTMERYTHDILLFNCFPAVAFGLLLYKYYPKFKGGAIPALCLIFGGIYLFEYYYLDYPLIAELAYPARSPLSCVWAFGLMCLLLNLEPFIQKHPKPFKPMLYFGKASFHIMLTQMVYFYFARSVKFEDRFESLAVVVLVDLALILPAGCLFYWLESKARSLVKTWRSPRADKKASA